MPTLSEQKHFLLGLAVKGFLPSSSKEAVFMRIKKMTARKASLSITVRNNKNLFL